MESSARVLRDGDRRARELYHYFQPDNPALLPTEKPTGKCVDPSMKSSAKASPNLVLTALAQLAAMRLGVQRAIISLIDRETLYVVAEASKSLNLDKNDVYDDDGDGLWMGCSRGPVAGTLCEKTITLKPSSEQRYPFFIVNDLKDHPTFCNIPCVAQAPHFRYYAGTPLVTSNGINIGSLYVIDPRPNLSITESQKDTLGNLANAVMEYMETSRQSLEADRLAKVLSGLNSFVQGAASSDIFNKQAHQNATLWNQDLSHTHSPSHTPYSTLDHEPDSYFKDAGNHRPKHSTSQTNSADDSDDLATDAPRPPRPTRSPRAPRSIRSLRSSRSSRSSPSPPPSVDFETFSPGVAEMSSNSSSNRINQTFQRAANIIRQSLDLGSDGGVVIFGNNGRVELGSPVEISENSDPRRKLATIWAMSDNESLHDTSGGVSPPHPAAQMDLHFARRFLRRYRRGGLWHFHQDGTAFSSDDDEANPEVQQDFFGQPPPLLSIHPQSFNVLREKDQNALKKYFPFAKRIMFVPLWDSFNSRWFGGCFSWSCLETRVFSAHVELGGFFGFGSSLMVEYSRIQSQDSDKKKDDFISTISHELRSPLHGILAANEFLAEYIESEFARRLLDTIRACGQTLLDTFEQILDFAKINSFASKRQRSELTSSSARARQVAGNGASPAQRLRILKLVDVVAVIEDVIESVYSGRILASAMPAGNSASGIWSTDNGTTEFISAGQIDVFIHAAPRGWEFLLEPGALRRVVMNVFGNALKYTQKGTISVHLDVVKAKRSGSPTSSEDSGSPELLLTISDTGKGISREYLRSDIFTPFSQEDVLSPGTGLGLSLVRDILRSLNGDITIESQVGLGTTVKMNFPLGQPQEQKNLETTSPIVDSVPVASNLIKQVRTGLQGKTLRFVTAQNSEVIIPTSNHVIKDYLTEWFGMNLHTPDSTGFVDLLVVDECELNLLENPHSETLLLILCHRRPTWSTMTKSSQQPPNTLWLTLPCGPHQLARTLAGSVEVIRQTQPSQLDKPSPLGFTENLHELGTLLKSHNLSDQQTRELTLVSDTLENKAVSNTTTIHNQVTLKANMPSSGLLADKVDVISDTHNSLTTESGAGIRILLVEDNAINLALLEKYLARTNPEILHTAVNGQEAVKSVQAMTAGYHYIFMDLSMPIMDGFEATRSIRLLERARPTESPAKIIALTGLGSDEHIMKAYAAGVDVFLTKPISFKDILRLLNDQQGQTTENKQ